METTIVYVFGPMSIYNDYNNDKSMPWVKIGMTVKKGEDVDKCALDRIRQESRTGIPCLCRLYDTFQFPIKGRVDDRLRNKLTEQLYKDLETSASTISDDDFHIKPGREFVYNVRKSQIKNAVVILMFEILADVLNREDENVKEVFEIMSENIKSDDYVENSNQTENPQMKFFWDKAIKKIENTCGEQFGFANRGRDYLLVPSKKHNFCNYVIVYSRRKKTIRVEFETYAGKGGNLLFDLSEEYELRDCIQMAINSNMPHDVFFDLQNPCQGAKRTDKWSWICANDRGPDDEVTTTWIAESFIKMYDYFESLDIESFVNQYKNSQ